MFCRKCGNEISDNARFCNICGEVVKKSEELEIPEMTLEESITFVEKLKYKYNEIEKLERQVMDNEALLSKPLLLDQRKYSFFRFFWVNLIWAAIAYIVMLIITAIATSNEVAFGIFLALMFIIPVVILVVGAIRAKKRCDEENAFIAEDNEQAIEKMRKLEKDTAELRSKLAVKKGALAKDSAAIPEYLRKGSVLAQIKTLLQTGKASNIQEAIALLRE